MRGSLPHPPCEQGRQDLGGGGGAGQNAAGGASRVDTG
jgi:hypothetical protein